MRDTGLISFLCSQAWALHAPVLEAGIDILERHIDQVAGESRAARVEVVAEREAKQQRRRASWMIDGVSGMTQADEERGYFYAGPSGSIAVVPVSGMLSKYSSMINGMSQPQGMSTGQIDDTMARVAEDRRVRAMLMDLDTPGGTVAGASDLIDSVQRVRDAGKGTVALAHDMAASMGYWFGLACDSFYATPFAQVGSIGVYKVVRDTSESAAKDGVKRYVVSSGTHKGVGEYGVPVKAEHIEAMQDNVDAQARVFKAYVGERRGLSSAKVEALATGRVFVGEQARAAGLIDGVANFAEIVAQMARQTA